MKYSINKRAEKIVGKRKVGGVVFIWPGELNYCCPICGNSGESLQWSEYNGFIWCGKCDFDIPSPLCVPDLSQKEKPANFTEHQKGGLKNAIKIYLDCIEDTVERRKL